MSETTGSQLLARMIKAAKQRKFDEFEEALTEYIEHDTMVPEAVAEAFSSFGHSAEVTVRVEPLLWLMTSMVDEASGPERALALARPVMDVFPDSKQLREETLRLARAIYADYPGVESLLETTVAERGKPLPQALDELRRLMVFAPGAYLYQKTRARAGRVVGFDPDRRKYRLEFEDGESLFALDEMSEMAFLEPDDYRALELFEPEKLVELAESRPVKLVEMVLAVARNNELKFRDLKARLEPAVPKSAWSKWWKAVREKLRRHPMISMTDTSQPTLTLRRRPLSERERLDLELGDIDDPQQKVALLLKNVETLNPEHDTDADVARLAAVTLKQLVEPSSPVDLVLAASAVAARIDGMFDDMPMPETKPEPGLVDQVVDNPDGFLCDIDDEAVELAVVQYLVETFPERADDLVVALMPRRSANTCTWMAETLAERDKAALLGDVLPEMIGGSVYCADGLTWAWRCAAMGRYPELFAEATHRELATVLMTVATRLYQARSGSKQHPKLPPLRNALGLKKYALLHEVIEQTPTEEALHMKALVDNNYGLGEGVSMDITNILIRYHHELFAEKRPVWDDGHIYTTAAGLDKRREDLRVVVKEKMPENARKLSHARAFGDLSENAEYDAAKEEAGQLAQQAATIQEEIGLSVVIAQSLSEKGEVSVGSRVTAHCQETDEDETYTFLGPWDADPGKNIVSYQAPLSQEFMGKGPGDTVSFGTGEMKKTWTIKTVEPGL
ncbi:MAG: GreA/GreB family elongation factor [Planctomycetota bacterium]